jgi:hypothetical protein
MSLKLRFSFAKGLGDLSIGQKCSLYLLKVMYSLLLTWNPSGYLF